MWPVGPVRLLGGPPPPTHPLGFPIALSEVEGAGRCSTGLMEEQILSPGLRRLRVNKHIQVAKVDCPHGHCLGVRI